MKKSKSGNPEAIVYGTGTILITALILLIPATFLVTGGILPQSAIKILGLLITGIANFLGGWVTEKKATSSPLPMALISTGIYLLVGFILRGFLFNGVAEQPWWVIITAMIAAMIGTLTAAGKKQRVKRRI